MLQRVFLLFVFLIFGVCQTVSAETLDRVIAVVEDDVILEHELNVEVANIAMKLRSSNVSIPPEYVLRKQVLERLIVDKLQKQLAAKSGIQVSEEMLQNAVQDIASRNGMSVDAFRVEIEKQGMSYKGFEDNLKNEIAINQLRGREIASRIKVTDTEVSHFLETQGSVNAVSSQYHLGHILIAVSQSASSQIIQKANQKAQQVVADLRSGKDFKQMAISVSNDDNALKGGDLGWRTLGQIPSLFVDVVTGMKNGEISEPIRSPSGFHIVKILGLEGGSGHMVTKTKVRHILIKTNEIVDDDEAKKRLLTLRERITDGDDFAAIARAHSDDKGSAVNGGSLDWVTPGALVPPFEEAMNKLNIHELSQPVQTQFGWHLIQVLGRETQDNSDQFKKDKVRDELRKRKVEEETELWLRRLRDEAYVEIDQDRI